MICKQLPRCACSLFISNKIILKQTSSCLNQSDGSAHEPRNEHRPRDPFRIGPMCLTLGLGDISFEAAFGASKMVGIRKAKIPRAISLPKSQ